MYSEFKLDTADGQVLFCRKWLPEGETKAALVLIHGKGENTGRYVAFGDFLMDNGIAVFACDLRGHGLSSGKVGHTGPREKVLDDVDLMVQAAHETYPEKPIFVYGHSMGGNIVLDYKRLRGEGIKAFIVSSPWLYLKKALPGFAVKMVRGIAKVIPYLTIPTSIDIASISSIEAEQQRYANDKSMNSVITASTFRDIDSATTAIFEDAPSNKKPFLLVHGDDDLLVNVEGSRKLAGLAGDSCKYVEFAGSRHEILNDIGADGLKACILEYINENI